MEKNNMASDGLNLRGQLVIKDITGKIIYTGHNMIVKTGRDFIREKTMLNAVIAKGTSRTSVYDKYILDTVKLGSSSIATEYLSISLGDSSPISIILSDSTNIKQEAYIEENAENNAFSVTINITGDSDQDIVIRELGLFLTYHSSTSETKNDVMFSRAVIDPIYLKSGYKYTIEYYIYF